jgi:pilus assembly protein CpaF
VKLSERISKGAPERPRRSAATSAAKAAGIDATADDGASKPTAAPKPVAAKAAAKSTKATAAKPAATRSRAGAAAPHPMRRKNDRRPSTELEGVDGLKATVRAIVIDRLGPTLARGDVDDARLRSELETALTEAQRSSRTTIPPSERAEFLDSTMADMLGWGALTPLMDDPSVTEIMCNRPDEVWVERDGRIEPAGVRFPSEDAYRQVIDRMLATAGRRVDEASPMADGRLPDGSRVNAIIPPLAVRGAVLTVRRFPETAFTVADLIARESLSADAAVFLEAAVRGKANVLVSGGTGTGKTTLLNVLSSFVPPDERIVTIEDAAELRLSQPHIVTLEARPANIEGVGMVTIRDLVRNALRMRPDRIVVGEVRDAAALDMLQAMNTGHEGSLTTVHANTPRDALSRIETMVLMAGLDLPLRAVREQIASALDLIVQLERRSDGQRVVSGVAEVQGREGETITLQDIFIRRGSGPLVATGLRPALAERLAERGSTVPSSVFRGKAAAARSTAGVTRRKR